MFYIRLSETIESQSNIFTNKKHNVMNKRIYEIPESEIISVKFEENIMSDGTWDNSIKKGTTWNGDAPEDGYGLE